MADIPARLAAALRNAQTIAVLTGAGVSAESGVPTFRDAQSGLWARFRPEELATPEAFQRDPGLVWEWYAWRRELAGRAEPNPGHFALAEMERRVPAFTLITQNVDGLHQRAGSVNVLELHGSLARIKCSQEGTIVANWPETGESPPACPSCGAPLRPDVVWFGEALAAGTLETAWEAARLCDIFFSIGTSGLVEPAASLAHVAIQGGAVVVEVNPVKTPLTSVADYALQGPSGAIIPELVRAAWPG